MSTPSVSSSQAPSQSLESSTNNRPKRTRHRNRNRNRNGNRVDGEATDSNGDTSSTNENSNRRRPNNVSNPHNRPNQRVSRADPRKVVKKPASKNSNNLSQRELEINQLQRAYPTLISKADESDMSSNANSKYGMSFIPSDPDFPFDIATLQFDLYIPYSYPEEPPMINVTNPDIPKGFSVNVDLGFRDIAKKFLGTKTLLDMMIELDKNLENFLKQEKRETLKIVKFKNKNKGKTISNASSSSSSSSSSSTVVPSSSSISTSIEPAKPKKLVIPPEILQLRDAQINQLKHRLGLNKHITVMNEDENDTIFKIELNAESMPESINLASVLPPEFDNKLTVLLQVPKSYNLNPCTIIICNSLDDERKNIFPVSVIESNFNKNAQYHLDWTLLNHVNFFVSRLGKLMDPNYLDFIDESNGIKADKDYSSSHSPENEQETSTSQTETSDETDTPAIENLSLSDVQSKARKILLGLSSTSNKDSEKSKEKKSTLDTERTSVEDDEKAASVDETESETDDDDDDHLESSNSTLEPRGTSILLPGLKMKNIGILECHLVNLVVKCERCSTMNDLFNIISGPYGQDSKPIAEECIKCKAVLAAKFRKNLIHPQENDELESSQDSPVVAGYLELAGCQPIELLASTFVPTCSNCFTTNNDSPFRRVDNGKKITINCKECHIRMRLEMSENIGFEQVTEDGLTSKDLENVRIIKRKPDEGRQKLGIVSGTPLPDDGACTHYRKSKKWYVFSCCGKVFPCDKCHDLQSNHPNEHATRFICGKCSREQNITSSCMYCHYQFDIRSSGFWEGGKGTRDPTKLNKNDPRKYKRLSGKKPGQGKNNKKKSNSN